MANLPEQIRGFGHVKLESVGKAKARWRQIEQALDAGGADVTAHKKAA
jgi:indolepyruvate ferredoxin oxidoreductase